MTATNTPIFIQRDAARQNRVANAPRRLPQAGLGIASLVMALVSLTGIFLLVVVIGVTGATFPDADIDEYSPLNYLIGGWAFAAGLLCLCGIVFGIGGLRQTNRRRSVATLGLCLNVGLPLGVMFILVLAMSAPTPQESGQSARAACLHAYQFITRMSLQRICQTGAFGLMIALGFYLRRRLPAKQIQMTIGKAGLIGCRRCKKQIPATAKFCRRCGHAAIAVV